MSPAASPADFHLTVSAAGDGTVLSVAGEVDMYTAPLLWDRLDEAIVGGARSLALDLADLSFIDSSGISVLVKAMTTLRARGGDLTLRSVTPRTYKVLEVTGLTRVMVIDLGDQPLGEATVRS